MVPVSMGRIYILTNLPGRFVLPSHGCVKYYLGTHFNQTVKFFLSDRSDNRQGFDNFCRSVCDYREKALTNIDSVMSG